VAASIERPGGSRGTPGLFRVFYFCSSDRIGAEHSTTVSFDAVGGAVEKGDRTRKSVLIEAMCAAEMSARATQVKAAGGVTQRSRR